MLPIHPTLTPKQYESPLLLSYFSTKIQALNIAILIAITIVDLCPE